MKITNKSTGQVISLKNTNDLILLRNQLALLGLSGLFYSPWARKIQDKIKKLESEGK